MPTWDLHISAFNDLIFGTKRDFQIVTGDHLLEQRVMLRLRMKRGSWVLDETKDLGGNLDFALRMNMPTAIDELELLVAEALEPISDEIAIESIDIYHVHSDGSLHVHEEGNEQTGTTLALIIEFKKVLPASQADLPILETPSLQVSIPIINP